MNNKNRSATESLVLLFESQKKNIKRGTYNTGGRTTVVLVPQSGRSINNTILEEFFFDLEWVVVFNVWLFHYFKETLKSIIILV